MTLLGAAIVGAAGFCAGFFGPILVNPEANQGPLMGIFITGPGGAALGLVVGFLLGRLGASRETGLGVLAGTAAVLAGGTLVAALPEPRYLGDIAEGTVTACDPPDAMKEEAFQEWDRRIASSSWAKPRPDWKEGFSSMAAADPGVVLTLKTRRSAGLYEHRKPWNKGLVAAGKAWHPKERFFYRGGCRDHPPGKTLVFVSRGEGSRAWPSDTLPNFLGLTVLGPAAPEHAALLP